MWPTTSNIFHKSSAFLPSSLIARSRSMRVGTRDVGSQCCAISFRHGTRGIEASSWGVVGPVLWRVSLGENA